MHNFITYPLIDPIIFAIGPIALRWYGLMYLLGFVLARLVGGYFVKKSSLWTMEQFDNLLFSGFLGVVLGGRIGYVLFYQLEYFMHNPLYIFRVWEGGMSFHGGLIGVIVAMILSARKQGKSFFVVSDFIAPLVPMGLFFGRIGNFINDELWGRVTDVSWAVLFPNGGYLPRHPSQLYEALLEGIILFIILHLYRLKKPVTGKVSGLFLICYGLFRIIAEYFREPDAQLGFFFNLNITMGQILSIPMVILGVILMYLAGKKATTNKA